MDCAAGAAAVVPIAAAAVPVAVAAALSPSRGFFELFFTHLSIGPQLLLRFDILSARKRGSSILLVFTSSFLAPLLVMIPPFDFDV